MQTKYSEKMMLRITYRRYVDLTSLCLDLERNVYLGKSYIE